MTETLSPRQLQVARLATEGLALKQIAWQLRISEHSARHHLRLSYARLGVHDRATLTRVLLTTVTPS